MQKLDQKWPFLGPKMAIFGPIWTQFRSKQLKIRPGSHFWSQFNRVDPIGSIRDRVDPRSGRSGWSSLGSIGSIRDRVDPIESIRLEMASWSNFKLFRPKLSPNRTKNGHFWSRSIQSEMASWLIF